MVKYTYTPLSHELNQKTTALLRQVWNYKHQLERLDHSEKCGDYIARLDWCIDHLRQKWKLNFVNFDIAIEKIKENDDIY